jgi:hypothetical protein
MSAAVEQQPDSLAEFAKEQDQKSLDQQQAGASFDGPREIRQRDGLMDMYQRACAPPASIPNYMVWNNERGSHNRPVAFNPQSSFKSLRDAGKLADLSTATPLPKTALHDEKKSFMPGYTGFIRGSQHIGGRTYGELTRRAYDTDYREHVCTSPIPSGPQANRKNAQIVPEDSFMSNISKNQVSHVPGYTGHVPGVRQTYAKSYGGATGQEMTKFLSEHPRANPQERPDFAFTARPRSFIPIDSAPVPGPQNTDKAPDKLIPSHLKYLRFFPL